MFTHWVRRLGCGDSDSNSLTIAACWSWLPFLSNCAGAVCVCVGVQCCSIHRSSFQWPIWILVFLLVDLGVPMVSLSLVGWGRGWCVLQGVLLAFSKSCIVVSSCCLDNIVQRGLFSSVFYLLLFPSQLLHLFFWKLLRLSYVSQPTSISFLEISSDLLIGKLRFFFVGMEWVVLILFRTEVLL